MSDINWIETEKELPPRDGIYEVTNHLELEYDPTEKGYISSSYYDGYGFECLGVYRPVKYWRERQEIRRKYGKIKWNQE